MLTKVIAESFFYLCLLPTVSIIFVSDVQTQTFSNAVENQRT